MIKVLHKQICLFWYSDNDNEFTLKESSKKCTCNIAFEKDVEYNIDAEFKHSRTKK